MYEKKADTYYSIANKYLKSAEGIHTKKTFTSDIVLSSLLSSLEHFLSALVCAKGNRLSSHSFLGILKEVEELYELDTKMVEKLEKIGACSSVCSQGDGDEITDDYIEDVISSSKSLMKFCKKQGLE